MINNHKNHNHNTKQDNRNNIFAVTCANNTQCSSCNQCEKDDDDSDFIAYNALNSSRAYQQLPSQQSCSPQNTYVNPQQGRQLKQIMIPLQMNHLAQQPPSRLLTLPQRNINPVYKNTRSYQEGQISINQSFQDKNNNIQIENQTPLTSLQTILPLANRFGRTAQDTIMEQDQTLEQDSGEELNCEDMLDNDDCNDCDAECNYNNHGYDNSNCIAEDQPNIEEFQRLNKLTAANRQLNQPQFESKQQGDAFLEQQYLKQQRLVEKQKQLIQLQQQQIQQQQQQLLMQQQQQQSQQTITISNQSNNANSGSQNQVFIAAVSSGGIPSSSGGVVQQTPIAAVSACTSSLGGHSNSKHLETNTSCKSRSRSRTPKRKSSQPDISTLSKTKINSKQQMPIAQWNSGLVKNTIQDIGNAYNTSSSLSSSNASGNIGSNASGNIGSNANANAQQQQVYAFQQTSDGNSSYAQAQAQQHLSGSIKKVQSIDNTQQKQPINPVSSFIHNSSAVFAADSSLPLLSLSYTLGSYNAEINLQSNIGNIVDDANNTSNYNNNYPNTSGGQADPRNSFEQLKESKKCQADNNASQQSMKNNMKNQGGLDQQTGMVNDQQLPAAEVAGQQQQQLLPEQASVQAKAMQVPKSTQQLPIQGGTLPSSSSSSSQHVQGSLDRSLNRNSINILLDSSQKNSSDIQISQHLSISPQQQQGTSSSISGINHNTLQNSNRNNNNNNSNNNNNNNNSSTGLKSDNLNPPILIPPPEGLQKEQIFHNHLLTELWDSSMNPQLDKDNPFAIFPIVTTQDIHATGSNSGMKKLQGADSEDKQANHNLLQQSHDNDDDLRNANPNGTALNDGEDEGKSQRGLRSLSLKVKEIVLERGSTTYKDVANALVAHLKTNNTNISTAQSGTSPVQQTAAQSKEEIKDEQNIKRRVYDALNVLIASEVIVKKGKKVCASQNTSLAGRCLDTDRWMIAKMKMENVEKQLEKVRKKRALILDLVRKFLALSALLSRNKQYEQLQRYYNSKQHELQNRQIPLPPQWMSHNILNNPAQNIHSKNYFVQNIRIPQKAGNANNPNTRVHINTSERNNSNTNSTGLRFGQNNTSESSNHKHILKDYNNNNNTKQNKKNTNPKQKHLQSLSHDQILSCDNLPIKYHFPIISLILNRGGAPDKSKKVLLKLSENNQTLQVLSKQPMKTLADLDLLCAIGLHKVAEKYKNAKLCDAFIQWQMEFEEKVAKNQVFKSSIAK